MNCLLHAIATRSQPPAACPPTCPPAHPSALPRRVAELEGFIRRHQEHVTRLEQVLRLLSNDEVTPEEVEGLKEGMQYYLESSTEPGFEPDETLYDTLPLSDVSPPPPPPPPPPGAGVDWGVCRSTAPTPMRPSPPHAAQHPAGSCARAPPPHTQANPSTHPPTPTHPRPPCTICFRSGRANEALE